MNYIPNHFILVYFIYSSSYFYPYEAQLCLNITFTIEANSSIVLSWTGLSRIIPHSIQKSTSYMAADYPSISIITVNTHVKTYQYKVIPLTDILYFGALHTDSQWCNSKNFNNRNYKNSLWMHSRTIIANTCR